MGGSLATFLETSPADMLHLLTRRLQCSEELLFYALLGWIDHKAEERRSTSDQLLACIEFRLFSQAGLEAALDDPDLEESFALSERLTAATAYRALSLEAKLSWWSSQPARSPRWPELLVVSSSSSSVLLSSPLAKFSLTGPGPVWRSLAKKPAELRRKSSYGSGLVYSHPRLYFLGGEKHWRLHWYDLELRKWGQEVGLPPARLLSGVAVVGDSLYLVGGVTLEQWEGVRGAAGSVQPSYCLDCYNLNTRQRYSQALLSLSGRDSDSYYATPATKKGGFHSMHGNNLL